jgi:L-asparaginase / beta-aspartyl-peptidase
MTGQADGRVGDSPVVGAGVYARDGVVAISGTGAVRETFEQELTQRDATGGLVAVGGDGRVVVAHNSPMMFSARGTGPEPALTT